MSNRYKFTIKESQKLSNFKDFSNIDSKINEKDDDFLDISDTELIRASQAVESQLKFTNNVHHATSNAITIFSQFTQNPSNDKTHLSTIQTINLNREDENDLKQELKQLRNNNMQKDGEVKILRDKLKRFEQEMQKMRAEKIDLIKKLQQQQDETKRIFQKQIESKEIENQFKSQEIMELTMKYKVLESSVKKNPNTVILASTPIVNQKIQQPKSAPLKRSAQYTSDTENENPDTKRIVLSNRCNRIPKTVFNIEKSKIFKRSCELNIKFREKKTSNFFNLIYKLPERISKLSRFLNESVSTKTSKDFIQQIKDLNELLKNLSNEKLDKMSVETIDFILSKLNEELIELFNLNQNNCDSCDQIDIICILFESLYRLFLVRFDALVEFDNFNQADKLRDSFILIVKQFLNILNLNISGKHIIYYAHLNAFKALLDMLNFLFCTLIQTKTDSKKQSYFLNLIENFHFIDPVFNTNMTVAQNNLNEDKCCILQLIFDKISLFFTEKSYQLDWNEKTKVHNELHKGESNQLEIITTIGEEAKNSKIDFKLENKISENYLMNNSLSETDDILQSQIDPISCHEEPKVQNILETVHVNNFEEPLLFDNLKLECYHKLIHFIYNYQIVQSIESNKNKLEQINKNELSKLETSCKKRKIYQSMSNLDNQHKKLIHNTCTCFKNILESFLSVLDYLFGDNNYLSLNQHNSIKNSLYFKVQDYEKNQNKSLLLSIGLNVFMSFANIEKIGKDIQQNKIKLGFINSVMEDYKILNFISLIKIMESVYIKNNNDKMEVDQLKIIKPMHLSNSLNALKTVFKNFIEEYLDFTKN